MLLSVLLPALLAATAIALPAANPEPATNTLKARHYALLQARYCPGGDPDNICGDGYFYVGHGSTPAFNTMERNAL